MKILRRDFNHYREAIQHILLDTGTNIAVGTQIPEFKKGKFTWWDRLWNRHKTSKTIHTLNRYPYKWTYITITYQVHEDTVYLLELNYTRAV